MRFQISPEQGQKAKIPHEIFLTNLIANHILWFVATLGVVGSYWQPIALVPVVSVGCLTYTIWRARRAKTIDDWFVMCHWQIAAARSWLFIVMLGLLGTVSTLGWIGYTHWGMKKVAVQALIGGVGILPVMVTVLVLIIMESDTLHQAGQGRLGKGIQERYPNPGVPVIEDEEMAQDQPSAEH